ncbi:alpha/beta hydrolase [Roseobacter sp.]|uniref:alpha/beta hydrolase n=1 Tax=Roseobacter sp. TaxID=1907202 RepID=UPI00398FE210
MMPLDITYANAAYIVRTETYPPKWDAAAAAFASGLGRTQVGVSYGGSDRQVFDFFNTSEAPKGTMIFVHGGYWKAFDRSSWSHLAAGPLAAGWSVAMPSYDLCPDVRISEITQQIAQAVQVIAARTEGPLALAGHSAGGHLVARMLDPAVLSEAVRDRIVRVAPISWWLTSYAGGDFHERDPAAGRGGGDLEAHPYGPTGCRRRQDLGGR